MKKHMGTLAEKILAAQDIEREAVECPEWGCTVHIRAATGKERDEWEGSLSTDAARPKDRKLKYAGARARLVVKVAEDEAGARIFSDDQADALSGKSGRVLDRLFDAAARLAGITEDESEKNSPTRNGSPTASP